MDKVDHCRWRSPILDPIRIVGSAVMSARELQKKMEIRKSRIYTYISWNSEDPLISSNTGQSLTASEMKSTQRTPYLSHSRTLGEASRNKSANSRLSLIVLSECKYSWNARRLLEQPILELGTHSFM